MTIFSTKIALNTTLTTILGSLLSLQSISHHWNIATVACVTKLRHLIVRNPVKTMLHLLSTTKITTEIATKITTKVATITKLTTLKVATTLLLTILITTTIFMTTTILKTTTMLITTISLPSGFLLTTNTRIHTLSSNNSFT
jgi:hypothetical protein